MKIKFCPIFLLILCSVLFAENYYVANTGADIGPGDALNPWETLQFAILNAKPGDTIIVKDGVYEGFKINSAGTADNPCRIISEVGSKFTINSVHSSNLTNTLICLESGAAFWEIKGISISNTSTLGISVEECSNITLENIEISNNYKGIHISDSSKVLIVNCNFNLMDDVALDLESGSNIEILNSLFYDNSAGAIFLTGIVTDLLIANNTVYSENVQDVILDFSQIESEVRIFNNIVSCDNSNSTIITMNLNIKSSSDNNLIFGKISTKTESGGQDFYNLAEWQELGNDQNSMQIEPQQIFNDVLNRDFSLIPNSPICDLGRFYEKVLTIEKDIAGNIRIQGNFPDLGAYESSIYDNADFDGDGLPNFWEKLFKTQVLIADADEDYDLDDLTNIQEFNIDTIPTNPDSDADEFGDGDEFRLGSNPLDDQDFPTALVIQPVTFPTLQLRQYFKFKFRYNNAVQPTKFTIIQGKLPSDLKFDEKFGKIEGWLSESGVFECVVVITDKNKVTDSQKIRLTVLIPAKVAGQGCNFTDETDNESIIWVTFLLFLLVILKISKNYQIQRKHN